MVALGIYYVGRGGAAHASSSMWIRGTESIYGGLGLLGDWSSRVTEWRRREAASDAVRARGPPREQLNGARQRTTLWWLGHRLRMLGIRWRFTVFERGARARGAPAERGAARWLITIPNVARDHANTIGRSNTITKQSRRVTIFAGGLKAGVAVHCRRWHSLGAGGRRSQGGGGHLRARPTATPPRDGAWGGHGSAPPAPAPPPPHAATCFY